MDKRREPLIWFAFLFASTRRYHIKYINASQTRTTKHRRQLTRRDNNISVAMFKKIKFPVGLGWTRLGFAFRSGFSLPPPVVCSQIREFNLWSQKLVMNSLPDLFLMCVCLLCCSGLEKKKASQREKYSTNACDDVDVHEEKEFLRFVRASNMLSWISANTQKNRRNSALVPPPCVYIRRGATKKGRRKVENPIAARWYREGHGACEKIRSRDYRWRFKSLKLNLLDALDKQAKSFQKLSKAYGTSLMNNSRLVYLCKEKMSIFVFIRSQKKRENEHESDMEKQQRRGELCFISVDRGQHEYKRNIFFCGIKWQFRDSEQQKNGTEGDTKKKREIYGTDYVSSSFTKHSWGGERAQNFAHPPPFLFQFFWQSNMIKFLEKFELQFVF